MAGDHAQRRRWRFGPRLVLESLTKWVQALRNAGLLVGGELLNLGGQSAFCEGVLAAGVDIDGVDVDGVGALVGLAVVVDHDDDGSRA